jgi:tetratricopeptide (TPR) repeat protein
MRNCERQADIYAYTLLDNAAPLISTFEKIAATSAQPPDKPNWHHFSIKERIDYLKRCERDKTWIIRHERKIKRSIAAYVAGMLLMGGVAYTLNFGETRKNLNKHLVKRAVLREIEKTPGNPVLYGILGDFYYNEKEYEETTQAYEKSIRLDPENPRILNNLAWLYATCEDKRILNPKRAVRLAKKALELDNSPHILDTLAESYYTTGNYKKAVETERRALNLAEKNRPYYEKQLKKISNAAKNNH